MKYLFFIILLITNMDLYCQDSIPPHFKGGDTTLLKFIATHINYPEEAMELNIQGTVYLSVLVEENGSISNIKVLKSLPGGCTEEAIRVINLTHGMWEPSIVNGKSVHAQINLPFKFKVRDLTNSTKTDYYKIGMDLMKVGKYRQAIEFFSNSTDDEAVKVDALYLRGLCEFYLKDFPNAISDWEEAMKFGCKDCKVKMNEAYKCIGDEFLENKKYQKAIVWYTKYLDNVPQDTDMLLKRGRTYLLMKDKEKACSDWNMAKELGSTKVQVLISEYCDK
jgi:TonB family protein